MSEIIKLYQFSPLPKLLNPSAPCMKVEVFLKLAGLPYEVQSENNPGSSPSGKLPFIKIGPEVITDSRFIISELSTRYNVDLDAGLSDYERSLGFVISRTCDDALYWELFRQRWKRDESWGAMKRTFFQELPNVLRPLLPKLIRRKMLTRLDQHGVGLLTEDQVLVLIEGTLRSISHILSNKQFVLGDQPRLVDASVYPILAGLAYPLFSGPEREMVNSFDNLKAYCANMERFLEDRSRLNLVAV